MQEAKRKKEKIALDSSTKLRNNNIIRVKPSHQTKELAKMSTKNLKKEIRKWIKDYEVDQSVTPHTQIDYDGFEGSAYALFLRCLNELK